MGTKKTGNPEGRPPKFKTAAEIQKKIDEYFKNCPDYRTLSFFDKNSGEVIEHKIPTPTISGLALYLGFCDRHSFYDYENNPEFSHTIKKARFRIEREYEKQLYNDKCPGAIFALKNLGWKDKVEQEVTNKTPQILVTNEDVKNKIEQLMNADDNKDI